VYSARLQTLETVADIVLHETGLRDGLQIEKRTVPTATKIAWLELLIHSGVDIIQVGSFVHPSKVPQMADTDALFQQVSPSPAPGRPAFSGLVLNEKGLDRALACGVEHICMGVSASEAHSRNNTGMTTQEAVARIVPMATRALAAGKKVQVSVQSAFGCGIEGTIPEARVLEIVRTYLDAGLRTISLADTAGHAVPGQVRDLYGAVFSLDPAVQCACHFHDTYGLAMANTLAALAAGVTHVESGFGGLGGCPFTAVTGGNLCTEDFVYLLQRTGRRQDVNLEAIASVASAASEFFGRPLPGTLHRIGPIRPSAPACA
jgi:hydroxymethylglutaryl-CoA lyase